MSPALPHKTLRMARGLVWLAAFAPVTGPLAVLLLPTLTSVVLIQAGQRRMLAQLLSTLALTLPTGVLLLRADLQGSLAPVVGGGLLALGVLVALFSPLWLAAKAVRRRRGTLAAGGRVLLALHGAWAPLLLLLLLLGGMGTMSPLAWLVPPALLALSLSSIAPFLLALPPVPELEDLAADLGLEAKAHGWQGGGIALSRKGRLTLELSFPQEIPGLYATTRGQHSALPLLGDAVLDHTLELSLPEHLGTLQEEPALLLEAVHGAGARVDGHGIHLSRALDTKAFRDAPDQAREQVLAQVQAIRRLFAALTQGRA